MKPSPDPALASNDELQRQARAWLRVLTSTDVRACDTDGFQRWLQLSPAHKQAFSQAKRRWDTVEQASCAFLRGNPQAAQAYAQVLRKRPAMGRRAFLGAAVSAAAVASVTAVAVLHPPGGLWPAPGEWGADDRTGVGEQRTLALEGEVKVTLNTQTAIRRRRGDGPLAGLELLGGEAAVSVPAGQRAFMVAAGAGRSLTEGGRFEVRYLDDKVCVTCTEGSVKVVHPAGSRVLGARQQTVYDAKAIAGIAAVDPAVASAWLKGELVFDETRLADVIAEINRYRNGRVVLMSDLARNQPVSGRFQIASLDAALAQLRQMFHLKEHALPGGLVLLS